MAMREVNDVRSSTSLLEGEVINLGAIVSTNNVSCLENETTRSTYLNHEAAVSVQPERSRPRQQKGGRRRGISRIPVAKRFRSGQRMGRSVDTHDWYDAQSSTAGTYRDSMFKERETGEHTGLEIKEAVQREDTTLQNIVRAVVQKGKGVSALQNMMLQEAETADSATNLQNTPETESATNLQVDTMQEVAETEVNSTNLQDMLEAAGSSTNLFDTMQKVAETVRAVVQKGKSVAALQNMMLQEAETADSATNLQNTPESESATNLQVDTMQEVAETEVNSTNLQDMLEAAGSSTNLLDTMQKVAETVCSAMNLQVTMQEMAETADSDTNLLETVQEVAETADSFSNLQEMEPDLHTSQHQAAIFDMINSYHVNGDEASEYDSEAPSDEEEVQVGVKRCRRAEANAERRANEGKQRGVGAGTTWGLQESLQQLLKTFSDANIHNTQPTNYISADYIRLFEDEMTIQSSRELASMFREDLLHERTSSNSLGKILQNNIQEAISDEPLNVPHEVEVHESISDEALSVHQIEVHESISDKPLSVSHKVEVQKSISNEPLSVFIEREVHEVTFDEPLCVSVEREVHEVTSDESLSTRMESEVKKTPTTESLSMTVEGDTQCLVSGFMEVNVPNKSSEAFLLPGKSEIATCEVTSKSLGLRTDIAEQASEVQPQNQKEECSRTRSLSVASLKVVLFIVEMLGLIHMWPEDTTLLVLTPKRKSTHSYNAHNAQQ